MNFLPGDSSGSQIVLYISDPRKVRESNTKIIKMAREVGYSAIIITTNFPSSVLEKLYVQNGIDPKGLYFIDAISKYSMGGSSFVSDEHHINISNPSDLTGISIAISEMMKKLSGSKVFVLIDSVSTMLIYLPSVKISQFVHIISSKLRQMNESGAILAVDGGLDPMLLAQMSSFVDEIIESKEN